MQSVELKYANLQNYVKQLALQTHPNSAENEWSIWLNGITFKMFYANLKIKLTGGSTADQIYNSFIGKYPELKIDVEAEKKLRRYLAYFSEIANVV